MACRTCSGADQTNRIDGIKTKLSNIITTALKRIVNESLALTEDGFFHADYDPQWPSQCQSAEGKWKPVPQQNPVNLGGLANALDTVIHPDICVYYSTFWSGSIETESEEGHVSLIQLWNQDDFNRLIENLVGHALMKRRSGHPLTIFFATAEPNTELFLSVDNENGHVLLEEPGRPPLRIVDESMATFLNRLTPVSTLPSIY